MKLHPQPLCNRTNPRASENYQDTLKIVHALHHTRTPMQDISEFLISAVPDIKKNIDVAAAYLDAHAQLPYHSASHHAVVSMFSVLIGRYHNLSQDEMSLLVLTAVVHDLDYNPAMAKLGKGLMEKHSIELARYMNILSHRQCSDAVELNSVTVFPAGRNDVLQTETVDIRRILSDADLIGSCGVSVNNYELETSLIEEEGGFKLSPQARYGFLKSVGPLLSVAGTLFGDAQEEILSRQHQLSQAT